MGKMAAPPPSSARKLFECLTHATDAEGRVLCAHFLELPDRAVLPAYYEAVEDPICVADIAAKVYPPPSSGDSSAPAYGLMEVRRDLRRLIGNARRMGGSHTPQHRDAAKLEVRPAWL